MHRPSLWDLQDLGVVLQHLSLVDPIPWNYDFKPAGWNQHCEVMGYLMDAKPIVIRVILRHWKKDQSAAWPREYNGYPIVYEYRPPAVAASPVSTIASGLRQMLFPGQGDRRTSSAPSIGRADPNTAGTLGGYLRNQATGAIYGVSCHHVLGPAGTHVYAPGPYEGRDSSYIGTVTHHNFALPSGPNTDCNFFAAPGAPRLDLAVAELHEPPGTHGLYPEKSVDGVRDPARMNPYQPVTLVGKVSGRVEAQLVGVTAWHELLFPDERGEYIPYCFGSLLEISDPQGDRGELVRTGDSGAWIVDEVGGMRLWNGMLVARLGTRAYGCYAQFILDDCNAAPELPGGVALL